MLLGFSSNDFSTSAGSGAWMTRFGLAGETVEVEGVGFKPCRVERRGWSAIAVVMVEDQKHGSAHEQEAALAVLLSMTPRISASTFWTKLAIPSIMTQRGRFGTVNHYWVN